MIHKDCHQAIAIQAIEELPDDIKSSVGYKCISPTRIDIAVAGEPTYSDNEHSTEIIRVEWFDSLADSHQCHREEDRKAPLDYEGQDPFYESEGYPFSEKLTEHGGLNYEQRDWPVVEVEQGGVNQPLYANRVDDSYLKGAVQQAICEELFNGSLLAKDDKGRFFRDDGSRVLHWQFGKSRK